MTTEALDHELRTQGIRVCVVAPAYINTPFDANLMNPMPRSTCIARSVRAWTCVSKRRTATAHPPPHKKQGRP